MNMLREEHQIKLLVLFQEVLKSIFIRRGGTDIVCFEQIFNQEEYSFLLDLKKEPNTILDCGGYIGLSAAYFSSKFKKQNFLLLNLIVRITFLLY